MKHPLGEQKAMRLSPQDYAENLSDVPDFQGVEFRDSLLCHVSPHLIRDRLVPSEKSFKGQPAIFFSRNEFMSNYGDYLYIFSENLLKEKYKLYMIAKSAHYAKHTMTGRTYKEKEDFDEYVCHMPVEISDAIGIIQHRNLSTSAFKEIY